MKTLLFVRHGKSSWEYQVSDQDRPLKERGIADAHLVSTHLKGLNYQIDGCVSSPANRALHTGMIFLRNLNFDLNRFQVIRELYDFSGEAVLNVIKGMDDSLETVLLFGHNYAFTSLVNMLGDDYIENLPTSGMAILEFDLAHWKDLKKGKTKHIVFPKELR